MTDLTPHPSGVGYTLEYAGWYHPTNGATIVADVYFPDQPAQNPFGFIFSSISANLQRIELQASTIATTPELRARAVLFDSGPEPRHNTYFVFPGETYHGRWLNRYAFSIKQNNPVLGVLNNTEVGVMDSRLWDIELPTKIGFSNWAQGSDARLVGAELRSITIYRGQYSQSFLEHVAKQAAKQPIHFLTDSFGNQFRVQGRVQKLINQKLGYIGISSDSVGGSTLQQQGDRMAAYNAAQQKWLDSTLVILDGGTEHQMPDLIKYLSKIIGHLNHDRWLYVESGSSSDAYGQTNSVAKEIREKELVRFCGTRYVPTLMRAMARATNSTQDQTLVDQLRWPSNLVLPEDLFHPSHVDGCNFLGDVIFDALEQHGWA